MIEKVFIFIVAINAIQALELPSYIKACKLSDPDFKNCAIKQTEASLPYISKGDATYKVPSLQPLILTKMVLSSRSDLELEMNDVELTGLDRIVLTDLVFDPKAKHFKANLNADRIQVTGKYKINGHILILPIQGEGPANITLVGLSFIYDADFNLIDKKGKEYLNFTTTSLGIKMKKAHIGLDNLFNGDPTLGPEMNKFLDENWAEVIGEFQKSFEETFNTIVTTILTGITSKVPSNKIFLD